MQTPSVPSATRLHPEPAPSGRSVLLPPLSAPVGPSAGHLRRPLGRSFRSVHLCGAAHVRGSVPRGQSRCRRTLCWGHVRPGLPLSTGKPRLVCKRGVRWWAGYSRLGEGSGPGTRHVVNQGACRHEGIVRRADVRRVSGTPLLESLQVWDGRGKGEPAMGLSSDWARVCPEP